MRGGWPRELAIALRLVAVTAAGVLLFACGASASVERASSSSYEAAPESPSVPPSRALLLGTWREVRENVLLRFQRNGTFKIGNDLKTPFAVGTYTLSGSTVRFKPVGPWCLEPWVWQASLRDEAGRIKDELGVYFVTRACDVAKKTKWRFARVS